VQDAVGLNIQMNRTVDRTPNLFGRLWQENSVLELSRQPGDNFLLLRFVAASLVVISHSFDTMGVPGGDFLSRSPLNVGFNFGIIGVCMFFFVSGFLVTGSYVRRNDFVSFVRSRILRIVPAYAACIILSAFLIGIFCTSLPWPSYIRDPATLGYVGTNLGLNRLQWVLPGVFTDNPHPDNVNASLWTLPGEVRMYLYVTALGVFGLLKRRQLANFALVGLGAIGIFAPTQLPLLDYPEHFLPLAALFAGGAFCHINRASIPVSGYLLIALFILAIATHGLIAYKPIALICIAYFCLWFAYRTRWRGFNRLGDYSYGLYLWNWPIQQAIYHFVQPKSPFTMFALSYPSTLAVAILSWYSIERSALRFKSGRIRVPLDQRGRSV
jgi:peptidoglycan/LPS O-acetylase OafA/YrhL